MNLQQINESGFFGWVISDARTEKKYRGTKLCVPVNILHKSEESDNNFPHRINHSSINPFDGRNEFIAENR